MKKRFAIITDIHGNIEGLNAILKDIENKKIDEIICLGDTIDIGPNSKEYIYSFYFWILYKSFLNYIIVH